MNKNERDGSGVWRERAEQPKRRKVNIARDGIRRNYCSIKIYRILEVRLGKLTSSWAHTSFMAFQYPTHRSETPRDRGDRIVDRRWQTRERFSSCSRFKPDRANVTCVFTVKFDEIPGEKPEINRASNMCLGPRIFNFHGKGEKIFIINPKPYVKRYISKL